MTRRQRLATRGSAASAVATIVAAVSHTLGGGAAPNPLIVVAMAALLVWPSMLLMGSRPRPGRIAVTTVVAQAAFHGAFDALGGPSSPGAIVGGHQHHGAIPLPSGTGGESAAMLMSHVVAAAVTIALLAYGERAICRIVGWVVATASSRLVAPRLLVAPRHMAAVVLRAGPAERILSTAAPRGPPVVF